ncbi:MAG: aa3-type cytochrome c oxidase subunit IV [Alphaproteobacteria bacterium]|nr:aa3-type cytochrome c oxidase subunit IV [Alphaproteobacteria bacterium]
MDASEHQSTWRRFTRLTVAGIVLVAVVLVLMALTLL